MTGCQGGDEEDRDRKERFALMLFQASISANPALLSPKRLTNTHAHTKYLSAHQPWPDSLSAMATVHIGLNRALKEEKRKRRIWEADKCMNLYIDKSTKTQRTEKENNWLVDS